MNVNAALVSTWTSPVPGREEKSLEYAEELGRFWRQKAQEGKSTEPEIFLSEHTINMWMVKGDHEQLAALFSTEEVQLLIMKGDLLLKDFTIDMFHTGQSAEQVLGTYGNAVRSIA